MVSYDPTNLGRAVASLGLDFHFLSKDGLEGFSIPEKSQLIGGIVDGNLERGRWQAVIDMIYKDSLNVSMLYGGDRSELRDKILKSAQKSAQRYPKEVFGETKRILEDQGEQELLFRLVTEVPFDYETLKPLRNSIGDYLSDPEQGEQRTKTLYSVLGHAAFKNKELEDALIYFEKAEDKEEMGKIFEKVLSRKEISHPHCGTDILKRVALADPVQKESRLKQLVLASLPKKTNISPWKAFQIFKEHDVSISPEEKGMLYDRAVEKISIHEIKKADDLELSLLWAKKNTDSNSKQAYVILDKQEPDGEDVLKAASSGIKYEGDFQKREYYGIPIDKISDAHLKKLLLKTETPFDVRVEIARNFKDEGELKNLSKEAFKDGKLYEAYNLWVDGKGDPEDLEISAIRTSLITGEISDSRHFFLDVRRDPVGASEYYDALMEAKDFREAYEVALKLKGDKGAQRAREEILKGDLEKALSFFIFLKDEIKGGKGIEEVVEKTAETHNVPTELVREMIDKYHR